MNSLFLCEIIEILNGFIDKFWWKKKRTADCFYACKNMAILLHPIAPQGCEMFQEYMNMDESL